MRDFLWGCVVGILLGLTAGLMTSSAFARQESLEVELAVETPNGPKLTPTGCAQYFNHVMAVAFYRDDGVSSKAFMEFFEGKQEKVPGMTTFLIAETLRVYASKRSGNDLAAEAGYRCAHADGEAWRFYEKEMQ